MKLMVYIYIQINSDRSSTHPETFTLCDLNQEYLRSYCLNNGICYTLVNSKNKHHHHQKTNHQNNEQYKLSNSIVSDIFCSCANDYTGTRCEQPIGIYIKQSFLLSNL